MSKTTATLQDGRQVRLRPLEPDDGERLRRTFEGLSPDSRYRRFFMPRKELSDEELDYLVRVDHRDHEAIAGVEPDSGEILGVARYVRSREDPDRAEAAVAVIDSWQRRGLGRALLEQLADRARQEEVAHFTAVVQADNRRAMDLLSEIGPTTRSFDGDVVELDIDLPEQGLGAGLTVALRGAAGSLLGTRPLAERILHRAKAVWDQVPGSSTMHRPRFPRRPG